MKLEVLAKFVFSKSSIFIKHERLAQSEHRQQNAVNHVLISVTM